MAKPDNRDNRDNNESHLQGHIDYTVANLRDAEDYLDGHASQISDDEKQAIEAKNDRRKESIKDLKEAQR